MKSMTLGQGFALAAALVALTAWSKQTSAQALTYSDWQATAGDGVFSLVVERAEGEEPRTVLLEEVWQDSNGVPLPIPHDNIYRLSSFIIGDGITLDLTHSAIPNTAVHFLVDGDVVIDGTIDLSGENGNEGSLINLRVGTPSRPGPGGWPGGGGAHVNINPSMLGAGPRHVSYSREGRAEYNPYLLPLVGGSGGAGRSSSSGNSTADNCGGGAGGGGLLIASSQSIYVNGQILAQGGSGGSGCHPDLTLYGGAGGNVRLMAQTVFVEGLIDTLKPEGTSRYEGGAIRIESMNEAQISESAVLDYGRHDSGDYSYLLWVTKLYPHTPILIQERAAILKVVSIQEDMNDGTAPIREVPDRHVGHRGNPDVTLESGVSVVLNLEAWYLPDFVGSIDVSVTMLSENEGYLFLGTYNVPLVSDPNRPYVATATADLTQFPEVVDQAEAFRIPMGASELIVTSEWDL